MLHQIRYCTVVAAALSNSCLQSTSSTTPSACRARADGPSTQALGAATMVSQFRFAGVQRA